MASSLAVFEAPHPGRFMMGFLRAFVFLWLCLCMKKTISSLGW